MRMQLTIAPETSQLRVVRRAIEGWSAGHDVAAESLCLIATELVANAISVSPGGEDIELTLGLHDQQVTLTVSDAGASGFHSGDIGPVGPESLRGRGLHIVNSLASRLTVERVEGRTVVTVHQYRRMLGPVPGEEAGSAGGARSGDDRDAGDSAARPEPGRQSS